MTSGPVRILVVDDEPPIRKLLRMGLGTQGYQTLDAPDGRTALALVDKEPVDLVILDLGLPDLAGHEVLRSIRGRKPDLPIVVLARLRTALRHRLAVQGERPIFRVDDLSVDLVRRIVRMGEREVKLSRKEYEILRAFVQHAGKVLTHAHMLREVWGSAADAQYLRVYIRQLRQKLEPDPERPRYILTETGVGYRLREPS